MSEELPKQELLTKLLKMTASPNDGEALTAMRKANSLLSAAGWDWDKLIAGKIVVVGDPFASIKDPTPPKSNGADHWAPSAPPRPPNSRFTTQSAASAAPQRAAPPPPPPRPRQPYSSKPNIYPGGCYCCGITVDVDAGFVFEPHKINSRAMNLWAPICTDCNKTRAFVPNTKTKRHFPSQHPSVAPDLNSL